MKIADRVALITGGASGLGAATAQHLAIRGARVAVLDFDIERAQSLANSIGGYAVRADVSDEGEIDKALDEVCTHFGSSPSIIVNCAGVGFAARIVGREGKTSFDLFDKTLRVNLYGTYNVMTHAAARLIAQHDASTSENGVIINTASVASQDGQVGQAAYAASKGGISSLCLPAARELAQFGIRVVTIAPGLFKTPMMQNLPEEVADQIVRNIPFPKRLGSPEEFALLAEQIIENQYLNGTTIRIDGATRLPPR